MTSAKTFYFFLSNLDAFYFLFFFLGWLLCLVLPTLCWLGGKSEYPCFVSDFRGKAFSSSPLGTVLAVGMSHVALIMLKYILSTPTLSRFVFFFKSWKDVEFCQMLFLLLFSWSYDFYASSYEYGIYPINWSVYVEPSLQPKDKFHLTMCLILLMCCWVRFASILLRNVVSITIGNASL